MRKELVVFVGTSEEGVEASIRTLKQNPEYILIEHEGHKFAIRESDLTNSVNELKTFKSSDNNTILSDSEPVSVEFEVEYENN